MSLLFRAAVALLMLVSLPAFAMGDAAAGQAKSAICAACHGMDGNSAVPTATPITPTSLVALTLLGTGNRAVSVDELLVGVGRAPNVGGLGLEEAGERVRRAGLEQHEPVLGSADDRAQGCEGRHHDDGQRDGGADGQAGAQPEIGIGRTEQYPEKYAEKKRLGIQ